jgi:hypothetical protein
MTRSVASALSNITQVQSNLTCYLTGRETEIRYVISLSTSSQIKVMTDLQHTLFYITFGEKLYLAPIGPNLQNVLDIATGNTPFNQF